MKSILKIGLGITLGFILIVGGCSALIAGSTSGGGDNDIEVTMPDSATTAPEPEPEPEPEDDSALKDQEQVADPDQNVSLESRNAVRKAFSYLDTFGMSKEGLIGQLKYEGFPADIAKQAANVVDEKVDFKQEAVEKARSYQQTMAMSKEGLIGQLKYEGFTTEQATYAVNQVF